MTEITCKGCKHAGIHKFAGMTQIRCRNGAGWIVGVDYEDGKGVIWHPRPQKDYCLLENNQKDND